MACGRNITVSPKKSDKPANPAAQEAPPAAAAGSPAAEEALRSELAAKEKLAQSYFDQLLRLKAEFENYRRRVDREKPELIRYGRSEILARVLPLYDVLEAAHEEILKGQAAGGAAPKSLSAHLESVAKGMELIFKEFEKLFDSVGIKPMEAEGKPYDHEWHDVMGTVERSDLEEGTVVEVLQSGYLLDGKVLRHAKVRISKKPPAAGGDVKGPETQGGSAP
jgi:molecular chaperone GrpE